MSRAESVVWCARSCSALAKLGAGRWLTVGSAVRPVGGHGRGPNLRELDSRRVRLGAKHYTQMIWPDRRRPSINLGPTHLLSTERPTEAQLRDSAIRRPNIHTGWREDKRGHER